jgi:predicted component of type VI protein secretion system
MAYVVVSFKDQEIVRRPLGRSVEIGRAPECDIVIRDILLSRRHCRIEKDGRDWYLTDLGSKNGTRIGGQAITHQKLRDGDVIRLGKTAIRFCRGAFVSLNRPEKQGGGLQRPADPFDAMAGTVTDFEYKPQGRARETARLPMPRPSPRQPASYEGDQVQSLVSELVSSSWDSIYEHAARPNRPLPRVGVETIQEATLRPRHAPVDLALQVRPEPVVAPFQDIRIEKPRHRLRLWLRKLAMIFQWLMVCGLLWVR